MHIQNLGYNKGKYGQHFAFSDASRQYRNSLDWLTQYQLSIQVFLVTSLPSAHPALPAKPGNQIHKPNQIQIATTLLVSKTGFQLEANTKKKLQVEERPLQKCAEHTTTQPMYHQEHTRERA